MLLRHFRIASVHFVARGLDFHCIIFVFKGKTGEIQGTHDKVYVCYHKTSKKYRNPSRFFSRTGEVHNIIYPFLTFLTPSERFEAGESAGNYFL